MNAAKDAPPRSARGASWLALVGSAGTLVCCALPALLVAVGAGAALSSLVSAVPQLVWLSAHKDLVFAVAAVLLAVAGAAQWHARRLPCPIDPALRHACLKTRRNSVVIYAVALFTFGVGAAFAYIAPMLMA